MLIASSGHTPFYIAAGALALWAVVIGAIGIKSTDFPSGKGGFRLVAGVTFGLVIATVGLAIVTAGGEKNEIPRPEIALGVIPQPGAAGQGDAGADASNTPDAPAPSGGPVKIAAAPGGKLAYEPKEVTAKAGQVEIVFSNGGPLPHNVVIKDPKGSKPLGETPTISSGSKTLKANLTAGTYTFYCSVPGHEAAGMVGKLTVS